MVGQMSPNYRSSVFRDLSIGGVRNQLARMRQGEKSEKQRFLWCSQPRKLVASATFLVANATIWLRTPLLCCEHHYLYIYRMPKKNRQNELEQPFFIRSQIIEYHLKDNFIDYNRVKFYYLT